MDAVAFFLLAVSLTLIVVGLSRLLSWFLDRRDAAIHAEWRAKQLIIFEQTRGLPRCSMPGCSGTLYDFGGYDACEVCGGVA